MSETSFGKGQRKFEQAKGLLTPSKPVAEASADRKKIPRAVKIGPRGGAAEL